mmetsp:Transcript_1261/g.2769  ORF Transcript_1261/g.2769 Transcript_1261/m.2769 type:complete len:592 (-) Transcript_1261:127-1902(-)
MQASSSSSPSISSSSISSFPSSSSRTTFTVNVNGRRGGGGSGPCGTSSSSPSSSPSIPSIAVIALICTMSMMGMFSSYLHRDVTSIITTYHNYGWSPPPPLFSSVSCNENATTTTAAAAAAAAPTTPSAITVPKQQQQQQQQSDRESNVPTSSPTSTKNVTATAPRKDHVVLFIADAVYADAVAHSIVDIKRTGGYKTGDVAVILDEGERKGHPDGCTVKSFRTKIENFGLKGRNSQQDIFVYTVEELYSILFDQNESTKHLGYLKEPPAPSPGCIKKQRTDSYKGYYLKTLMFHPIFADKWDKVLYLDGCMTFHSPHVNEILRMHEVKGSLLASLDPWQYSNGGLQWKLAQKGKCFDETKLNRLRQVLNDRPLKYSTWYNSAFVFYDTSIVRDYDRIALPPPLPATATATTTATATATTTGNNTTDESDISIRSGNSNSSSSSIPVLLLPGHRTLIEMLVLYHEIGSLFKGGSQQIHSVYWLYVRQRDDVFRILPSAMLNSPRIPYEFHPRMPDGEYIITAGNVNRDVCTKRPTNHVNFVNNNNTATTKTTADDMKKKDSTTSSPTVTTTTKAKRRRIKNDRKNEKVRES